MLGGVPGRGPRPQRQPAEVHLVAVGERRVRELRWPAAAASTLAPSRAASRVEPETKSACRCVSAAAHHQTPAVPGAHRAGEDHATGRSPARVPRRGRRGRRCYRAPHRRPGSRSHPGARPPTHASRFSDHAVDPGHATAWIAVGPSLRRPPSWPSHVASSSQVRQSIATPLLHDSSDHLNSRTTC